ncbi:MAG: AAA family ATPase, partial [Thermoanaerobaculia bacterium]
MAITQLTIEGFRSLKHVEWKPAPLNVLIGPNGSGKSNLLRALRLLRSAADGTLKNAVFSAGGMGALVWDSRAGRIAWRIELNPDAAQYELTLHRLGQGAEYIIEHEFLKESAGSITRNGRKVTLDNEPVELRGQLDEAALHLLDIEFGTASERLRSIAI